MARKGSVLVVDDEEIMRDVLETVLSADGYRVDLAKTGEEGLDAYTRRSYDAVLLDVSMPGIGGIRALGEVLRLAAGAEGGVNGAPGDSCTAQRGVEDGALRPHYEPLVRGHQRD